MVEDLKLALTDRSNDLSYEKKYDLKKVLRFHDEVLGKEGLGQGNPPSDMGIYEMLFDEFKKLTWLRWGSGPDTVGTKTGLIQPRFGRSYSHYFHKPTGLKGCGYPGR